MRIRSILQFSHKHNMEQHFILEEMLFLRENPALECAGSKEGAPGQAGAEVAAGSSEPLEFFAFFCQAWVLFYKIISSVVAWFVTTDTSCSKELSSHPSTILLEIYLGRKLVLSAECEKAAVFWLHFFVSFPFHLKKPVMPQIPAPASK